MKTEGPELDICLESVKSKYMNEEIPETQN